MYIQLSDAIRNGAHPMPTERHDYGYLQHGTQPGPFRTERVAVRHSMPDIWHARFEGHWRLVHVGVKRCHIVFQGQKITIRIEGV